MAERGSGPTRGPLEALVTPLVIRHLDSKSVDCRRAPVVECRGGNAVKAQLGSGRAGPNAGKALVLTP